MRAAWGGACRGETESGAVRGGRIPFSSPNNDSGYLLCRAQAPGAQAYKDFSSDCSVRRRGQEMGPAPVPYETVGG